MSYRLDRDTSVAAIGAVRYRRAPSLSRVHFERGSSHG